jgi:nitroimidazol reductase NimA-like FMN-containing flavoprotein (pyridoxamine 5'-phosphate oxidase superfamily)
METVEEKTDGLNILMKHQTGKETRYNFPEEALAKTAVYKMEVEEFTGKQREIP